MKKDFLINDCAITFYKRWKKDTKQSLLVSTPLFLLLFIVLPLIINGPSVGLFIFFIIPLTWIGLGFIYTPYFKRKIPLNSIVRRVYISHEDKITIETFGWFSYKPILEVFDKSKIEIMEVAEIGMLEHKNVFALKSEERKEAFYIVKDFFDNSNELLKLICKEI